jgi:hypothetical protein
VIVRIDEAGPEFALPEGHYRLVAACSCPADASGGQSMGGPATLRSARTSDAVEAFEAGLLTDLVRGALGPFTWDVVDEDWYVYVASGDDPSSLGDYLDPDHDEAPFRERRKALITPQSFDLRAAATPQALVQTLAAMLNAEHVESPDDFERWLATRPVSSLPRSWALRVHPELAPTKMEWFTELFFRAQPRLRYSWTTSLARAARASRRAHGQPRDEATTTAAGVAAPAATSLRGKPALLVVAEGPRRPSRAGPRCPG